MTILKLGIDDAGRGPVIGPLVLAGCLINEDQEKEFRKLGIKDSKELTPKRREFLAEIIKKTAENFDVAIITPSEIDGDDNGERIKLNELEAIACAKIINNINKGQEKIRVILDCPSPSISKWRDFLKTNIENLSNLEIICEHKADKNHIAVSAASILAKEFREAEMKIIKEKYGDNIGSGYPSDPLTQKFLEKYAKKYEKDGIFRKTWDTWQRASNSLGQKKLNF
ncbi:MAG TPA: ribonuclease HII [Candidatus Nanoarchaeia archaeon]|nr:ribonuclease HII [Candidatus Nanoarchaeia archaeon]